MGLQELYKYISVLHRRKWELIGVTGFVFVLLLTQLFFSQNKKHMYDSTIKMLVKPPVAMTSDEAETSLSAWFGSLDMLTDLYLNETVLQRVCDRLDLPIGWKKLKKQVRFVSETPGWKRWEPFTIKLRVKHEDPKMSKRIAEAIVEECVAYTKDMAAKEITKERRNLEIAAIEAKDKVVELQRQIVNWRKQNGSWDGVQVIEAHGERLLKMDKEIADKLVELNIARSRLQQIMSLDPGNTAIESFVSPTTDMTTLHGLQSTLTKERAVLSDLLRTYTPENYMVKIQEDKVERAQTAFLSEYQRVHSGVVVTSQAEISTLESTLYHLEDEKRRLSNNEDLVDNQVELNRLTDELTTWQNNLEDLQPRIHEASLLEEKRRGISVFTILSEAESGLEQPVLSKKLVSSLLPAFFLAMFLGIVVVFVRELLAEDLKFRKRAESLGLNILVELPVLDLEMSDGWAIATGNLERSKSKAEVSEKIQQRLRNDNNE